MLIALAKYILFLSIWIIYCKGQFEFHQDDYDIVHERLELIDHNKSAVRDPTFTIFKYNDTLKMKALNLSAIFLPGVKKNIICVFNAFKLVKKKYRIFPVNATFELCDEFRKLGNKNPFGIQEAILLSNFRGCPCPKGIYYIYNWVIRQDLFPPHLPLGKFKLLFNVHIDDTIFLFKAAWYGELEKKEK